MAPHPPPPPRHHRRITMNPPESFIQFAAMTNPQVEQVNNPIVFGEGGQAVMVPPGQVPQNSPPAQDEVQGGEIQLAPNTATATVLATTAAAAASSQTATSQIAPQSMIATNTDPTPTVSTASAPETAVSATALVSSASPTDTMVSSAITQTTDSATGSSPGTTATYTNSPSSLMTSHSSPASASSTASPSSTASISPAESHAPFTHTAPFIFLCVLGTLVLVAVIATSLSWVFRRPWFPCCSRNIDDDDDGLSDIVHSFHSHTPSRSSTIRRSAYNEKYDLDDAESALHRRSSLFANDPGQSPFLHSGAGGPTMWRGGGSGNRAPSIAVPTPAHLFGVTGPLEIRNGAPGDMEAGMIPEEQGHEHGTPREQVAGSTPRFLGLDGEGLDVPWGRQSSSGLVGLGIDTHPNSNLSSPYISAPDARDYLGPPFPSPQPTEEEHRMTTAASSPEHGSPQRAGTWASNLRNTLFAAIGGTRAVPPGTDEDRFTRPILPLHRNSTRRKGLNDDMAHDGNAFPIVVEDKDDQYILPHSDAEVIGSVFLAPTFSASSASTIGATIPRRAKMPLRGGAAERYRRYYARSNASSAEESSSESSSSWSVDDRVPSRLVGGERAKGVKGV